MSITDAVTVLIALERQPKDGIGLVSLSAQTEIDALELRKFVVSHPDMVKEVGNSQRYALNTDSKYQGSIFQMTRTLEEASQRKGRLAHAAYFVLGLCVGVAMTYLLILINLTVQA